MSSSRANRAKRGESRDLHFEFTLVKVQTVGVPRWCEGKESMYALAIVRYRFPLEEVLKVVEEHRAYLRELKQQGLLIAAGALDPRNGGALLLRVPDSDGQGALNRIRDNDPFCKKAVAQYEIWPWNPTLGLEDLDRI